MQDATPKKRCDTQRAKTLG